MPSSATTPIIGLGLLMLVAACEPQAGGPRTQRGTAMGIYAPEQHAPAYDGLFKIRGERIYQVGGLFDMPPWDHIGDAARSPTSVGGTVTIDINERTNTGIFLAALDLPEGRYVIAMDKFVGSSTCHDGGIAAYIIAHGDSGCGEALWPKTLMFVGGWGPGRVTLNGEPFPPGEQVEYEIGFMVTQGIRSRGRLALHPALETSRAGAVNPAMQQIAFYARSPTLNAANTPGRERFDHFFATRVIWE